MAKKPNILFFGIDSLRRNRMSLYGYERLTTPHITEYFKDGIVFNNCFSPSIPTTPGYASMLTGTDCFGTDVVALRHEGEMHSGVKTFAEILRENGYETTCVGFTGNPAARGFDNYIDYDGWGGDVAARAPKAENLNKVAIPELERLASGDKPWLLFLRHMDPHSPYLAPEPFHKMFYQGNEFDPNNSSLDELYDFLPFRDYFLSWFPEGLTDSEYVDAQYDAEIAYMDSCIQILLQKVKDMGIEDETIIVLTSDHGETLNEHKCYYDHHGLYDCTLVIPFAIKYSPKLPVGKRFDNYMSHKDILPTLFSLLDIDPGVKFDGRDLMPLINGTGTVEEDSEYYITECTWERKHGWRTPEWKLIRALEPDLHYREDVELYNLIKDPGELVNVADENPEIVEALTKRMEAHIAKRTAETGRENPMYTNLDWHGIKGHGPFKSSDEAYNAMHIGNSKAAQKLQARNKK